MGKTVEQLHQEKQQKIKIQLSGAPSDSGYEGEQRFCVIKGLVYHYIWIQGKWMSQQFTKGGTPLALQTTASKTTSETTTSPVITTTTTSQNTGEFGVFENLKVTNNFLDQYDNIVDASQVINHSRDNTQAHTDYLKNKQIDIFEGQLDITGHYQGNQHSYTLDVKGDEGNTSMLYVSNADGSGSGRGVSIGGTTIEGTLTVHGTHYKPSFIVSKTGEKIYVTPDVSGGLNLRGDGSLNISGYGKALNVYANVPDGAGLHRHLSIGVSNTSSVIQTDAGNLVLEINEAQAEGVALLPSKHSHVDLGAYNLKYKTLYVSELYAETLVAQDVMATIGGRILVAPTSYLQSDLNSNILYDWEVYPPNNDFASIYVQYSGNLNYLDKNALHPSTNNIADSSRKIRITDVPVGSSVEFNDLDWIITGIMTMSDFSRDAAGAFKRGAQKKVAEITYDGQTGGEWNPSPTTPIKVYPAFSDDVWGNISGMSDGMVRTIAVGGSEATNNIPMFYGEFDEPVIEWEATYKVVSSGGNGNEYWEVDWFGQNDARTDFWEGATNTVYASGNRVYINGVHQFTIDVATSSNPGIGDADDIADWDSSLGSGKLTPLGLTTEHNNFKDGEYAILSAAPGGIQQTEVVKFTSDGQWQVHEVSQFSAVPDARKQLFPDKNLNTRVTVAPTGWGGSNGHQIKNKSWIKLTNTHGITKYRWYRWKITEGHVAETKVATKALWLGDSAGGRWGETSFDWDSSVDGIGNGVHNEGGAGSYPPDHEENGLLPYWSDVYPGFKVWQTDSQAPYYRAWHMLDKYSSLDWITDFLPQDTVLGYSAVTMDFGPGMDRALDEYRIQNDGGRCPKTWTIEGSHNGVDWDILDTQTDVAVWTDNTWQTWTIDGDIADGVGYDGSHSVHFTNTYIDPNTGEEAEDTVNPLSILQFEIPTNFIGDLTEDDSLCYFTPFQYSIERDKDGTGINSWHVGDAIVSLGKDSGDGYIDLASTETTLGETGPVISINKRTSNANWNDMSPTIAMGNLRHFLDYGDSTMGLAIGNDLTPGVMYNKSFITADVAQGVRLQNVPLNMFSADQYQTVKWLATGELHIGKDITNTPLPAFSFFTGDTTYNHEDFTSGDLMIGSNADNDVSGLSYPDTIGNLKWDQSSTSLQIRSGQQVVHQFDSDGSGFLGLERGGATKGLEWDYNAVTDKYDFTFTGNLFVADGTEVVGPGMDWRGVWQYSPSTTYYRYDGAHYNGTSYIVNTSAPSPGGFVATNDSTIYGHPPTSTYWDELAVSGVGINPVAMDITSTEQIFFYNQDNTLITPTNEYITVKAHCQNGDSSAVTISPSNLLRETTSIGSSLLSSVAINTDCYMHKADFESVMSNNAATLTMAYDGVTDYKTFYKIQDAQDGDAGDGFTVIVSQSNYTFPCDEDGVLDGGFSYSEANPIITVFKNGVKMDYDDDTDSDVHFHIAASGTNIDESLSASGTPPNDCLITLSNLGAGTQVFASVDITISIYDLTGLQTTITKRWTGTKSTTGAHGKNVQIHPDRTVIKYDTNGDLDPGGSAQDIVISGNSSGVTGTWSWSVAGGGVGIASGADDYLYTIDVSQTTDPGGGGSWFVPGMTIHGERGGITDSVTIVSNTDGGEGRVGSTIVTYDHQSTPTSPSSTGEYLWQTPLGGSLTVDGPWSEVGNIIINDHDTYGNNHDDWFQTLVDAGTREIKFRYDDDNWAVLKCTSPALVNMGGIGGITYAVEVLASEGTHTKSISDGVNVTFDVNFAGLPATSFVVNVSNPAANVPVTNAQDSYQIDNSVLIDQTNGIITSYFNGEVVSPVYSFSAQTNCTTAGAAGLYYMATILDTSNFFAKFLLTVQHTDPLTSIIHIRYVHISCVLIPAGADGEAGISPTQYYLVTVGGGAVIHNGGGTINLRIGKVEGGVGEAIVDSGDYKLWDPGTGAVLLTQTGVTDGGDGVEYDAIFDEDGINESREIQLHSGVEVIDSIKLIDLVDGVESTLGALTFSSPLVWVQGPAPAYDWDPSTSSNTVTCNFYNGSTAVATCTQVVSRQADGDLYLGTKTTTLGTINVTSTTLYEKQLTVTFEDDASKAVVSETFYALSGQTTVAQLMVNNPVINFNINPDYTPGAYWNSASGVYTTAFYLAGWQIQNSAIFTVADLQGNGRYTFNIKNASSSTFHATDVTEWTNDTNITNSIMIANIRPTPGMDPFYPGVDWLEITAGGGVDNLPYISYKVTINAHVSPVILEISGESTFSFDSEAAVAPEGTGWLTLNWIQGNCNDDLAIGDFSATDADGDTCQAGTLSDFTKSGTTGNNTGTIRFNHVDHATNTYPITLSVTKEAVTDSMNILRLNSVEGPAGIAHGVMLQASHYFWTKAQDDSYSPSNIVLTAVRNGMTTPTAWSVPLTGGGTPTFSDNETGDNAVCTIPVSQYALSGYPSSLEITATADNADAVSFSDTITLVKVIDGIDGVDSLNYILENENVTLAGPPSEYDGINYATTATDIQVYEGGTALTFNDSVTPANGQYYLSHGHYNIDHGSVTGQGTTTAVIGACTNMSADDASTVYTITGKTTDGTSFIGSKTQTVSLARTATGLPGDTWKNFTVYKTSADESSTVVTGGSVDSVAEMTPPSGWSNTPTGALYNQPVWVSTSWWADYGTNTSWVLVGVWSTPHELSAQGADNQDFSYLFDSTPGIDGVNIAGGEMGIAKDLGSGLQWVTYFDSEGDMFLKGASDDPGQGGLTWDHLSNTLDVYGRINISSADAVLSSIHGLAIEAGTLNIHALTTFHNNNNLLWCMPSTNSGDSRVTNPYIGFVEVSAAEEESQFPAVVSGVSDNDTGVANHRQQVHREGWSSTTGAHSGKGTMIATGMNFTDLHPSNAVFNYDTGIQNFHFRPHASVLSRLSIVSTAPYWGNGSPGYEGSGPPYVLMRLDTAGAASVSEGNSTQAMGTMMYIETDWIEVDSTATYDLRFKNASLDGYDNFGQAYGWGVDITGTSNSGDVNNPGDWHANDYDNGGTTGIPAPTNYFDGELENTQSYSNHPLHYYNYNSSPYPPTGSKRTSYNAERYTWKTLIRETRLRYGSYVVWNEYGATIYGCGTTAAQRTWNSEPDWYNPGAYYNSYGNGGYTIWGYWLGQQLRRYNATMMANTKKIKLRFWISRGSWREEYWDYVANGAQGYNMYASFGYVQSSSVAQFGWTDFNLGLKGGTGGTTIDGGTITTGKIQSYDGNTFFDLENSNIQCKHAGDATDATVMNATDGFKRRGYTYPIFIGCHPHVCGFGNNSTNEFYGKRSNLLFNNPMYPISYESAVPAGRALMIQITPVGMGIQQLTSGTNPYLIAGRWCDHSTSHAHVTTEEWGNDPTDAAGGDSGFHYLFFYRASDSYQNSNYADGFRMCGQIFTDYAGSPGTHGPWSVYIPAGTSTADLRLCSIWTHLSGESATIVQRINYESITIWEVDAGSVPTVSLYSQTNTPIYHTSFTLSGNNPF